jgi:amidohydrolase
MGASAQLEIEPVTVAVVNDVATAARVRASAARVVGAEHVSAKQRWMASEDMSYFLREVGGCFFFLGGARHPSEFPHHNPRFDFDEAVLAQGVAILCEAAASYLQTA